VNLSARILAILSLVFVGALSMAQRNIFEPPPERSYGVFELAYGKVRMPNGKYRDVSGLKIPYQIERIYPGTKGTSGRARHPEAATAYRNDNGDPTYYVSGLAMPSALDDVTLTSAGQGQPWTQVTVGIMNTSMDRILLRWIAYDRYVSGLGAGVSAFYDVIADWGGFTVNQLGQNIFPSTGTWKITFDFSIVGIVVPDGECYFAAQFREPFGVPDGPFRNDFFPVFSGGGVSVGISDDLFWYDWDPEPNGVYEETEVDYFNGPPNEANFLLQIDTGGTTTELFPFSYTIFAGRYVSGSFVDLWFSDNSYLVVDAFNEDERPYPISVMFDSQSPTATPLSLTFKLESATIADGYEVVIMLFNYQDNRFDVVQRTGTSSIDREISVTIGSNPAKYVHPSSRAVRALVQYRESAVELAQLWWTKIDRATWLITRP